jgi:hypothetical protein
MDGKTVARLRLAERTAAELQLQNTHLSSEVLRMADKLDQAVRASHIDRLLTAALLNALATNGRAEIPILDVDALRLVMQTPPGAHVFTEKDEARGVWIIELRANPAEAVVIHDCAGCGQDHIDPVTRVPTPEEMQKGIVWVATCPAKGVEVFMAAKTPEPSAIAQPGRPRIEIAR